MEAAAEQLEVVGDDDESARGDEREQRGGDDEDARDPDGDGAGEAGQSYSPERFVPQPRPQGPAVQLVERVRADADAEEEGAERGEQAVEVEFRRRGRAERDVAQMPGGVGRVKKRDEVAPSAGPQRVEGGPLKLSFGGRRPSPPT